MKSIQFLVFIFVLISVKLFTPNSIPYSTYYSPTNLFMYFINNEYWNHNSIFFQFDSYLSKNETEYILSIMIDIYAKYRLYGVFLVFDDKVGINDISDYATSVARILRSYTGNNNILGYIIIIEYTVGDYGSQWENKLSIFTVGSSAKIYLSNDGINNLINEYSSSLKYYNFNNVLKFINGVNSSMDNSKNNYNKDNGKTSSFDGKTFLGCLLILLFCCCGVYCRKKKRDRESYALTYKEPINETPIVENSIVNVKATKIVAYREHDGYAEYAEYTEYAEYSEY